ncbi:MAG: tetratricopeptide repeat protein [Terriglobales bacterium]
MLTLLTLLAYNPAAHNDFVSFDDPTYVTGNQHVRAGLTWETVKWAFHSTEHANWHPLTWLSHALDYQLFHLKPAGHHYMSVLMHAICAVLLFLFLEAATGMAWRSAVVAALFAVHPINVESVAWVSERKSVLCMLFFALTLLAYRWYAQNPNVKRYGLVAVLFALGLMSKPMVITLPFVLLLLDYWPLGRVWPAGLDPDVQGGRARTSALTPGQARLWTRLVWEKVPLFALSGASAVITMVVQKAGGAMHNEYSFWDRLLNAIVSYSRYVEKAIWPTRLAAFYPHPEHPLPAWQVALSALFLLSITLAVLTQRKARYLTVGWFWYLGTMVPVIGLVQVGEQGMADRYAYIPLIGLFIAAVWGIGDWARAKRVPALYLGLVAAVAILGFSAITRTQIGYWKNTVTLWSHTLAITERNFVAHDSMGAELIGEGKIQEAMAQFQAAAAINPRDAFSQLDLGVCEKRQGDIKGAVERYETALRLSAEPTLKATALGNLGSIYRVSGDYARARENYDSSLQLLPDNKIALIGLGLIAQKTGDLAHAVDYYAQAVKAEPSDAGYLLLAQALAKAGRAREAQVAHGQAQKMSPDWNATEQAVNHLLQE